MAMTRRELIAMGMTAFAGSVLRAGEQSVHRSGWHLRGESSGEPFVPDVELSLVAEPGEVELLPGEATTVWRFRGSVLRGPASSLQPSPGSYLGPTLRLRRGQRVRIRFSNRLPDPSIVHWHGLNVPAEADGHPRLVVPAGGEYVYEFEVTNRAGTYWYHPHPHMQTAAQIHRGLAGVLIVTDDEEERLGLPNGAEDLVCVVQDRHFDAHNQLAYAPTMMQTESGLLGERVLVNGRVAARWTLHPRAYRVRIVNASNARIYKLAWNDGTPMTVLATDGGLLERPLTRRSLTLAPAQRADLWVDLSERSRSSLELRGESFALADAGLRMGGGMGGMGGMRGNGAGGAGGDPVPLGAPMSIVKIDIGEGAPSPVKLPATLGAFAPESRPSPDAPLRRIPLGGMGMQWMLGAGPFALTEVGEGETVVAGSTHLWEFVNGAGMMGMQMAHPIHVHGRQFRVVNRSGGAGGNSLREGIIDDGWMDTVLVLPGETVRIQVTFTSYPGLYLYHCHILEHEDMGMMRNFRVVSS